jgi:hypothetical protein
MAKGVKIECPACAGKGCGSCSKGRVRAYCACGHAADLLAGPLPMCEGCAAICVLCAMRVDRFVDGLPFGGTGLAHTACVLGFDSRYLEDVDVPEDSEGADQSVHQRLHVSTKPRVNKATSMPTPSQRMKDLMRADGFIPVVEAAQLSGAASTTLYAAIERGILEGRRAGHFHFVALASLEREYPYIKAKLEAAADPTTPEAA